MNYYFIVTDINSRQYAFPIDAVDGLSIFYLNYNHIINIETRDITSLLHLFESKTNFVVNKNQIFNTKNLISIEIRTISEGAY